MLELNTKFVWFAVCVVYLRVQSVDHFCYLHWEMMKLNTIFLFNFVFITISSFLNCQYFVHFIDYLVNHLNSREYLRIL